MHYHSGKYLSELFNPLTSNEYTFKDSFDDVTRIKKIPQELLDQGYSFVSLMFYLYSPTCHYTKQSTLY